MQIFNTVERHVHLQLAVCQSNVKNTDVNRVQLLAFLYKKKLVKNESSVAHVNRIWVLLEVKLLAKNV